MFFDDLDKLLQEYTPTERFYKSYYEAGKNDKSLTQFLEDLDPKYFENYYFPGHTVKQHDYFDENMFPIMNNNILVQRHFRYTPPFKHAHSFIEMIYVYQGSCKNTVEDIQLNMKQGDICIISPETYHTIEVFDDSIVVNILIKKATFNATFFTILSNNNPLSCFFQKVLYTNNADNYILFHTQQNAELQYLLKNFITEAIIKQKNHYSNIILENLLCITFCKMLGEHANDLEISNQKHTKEKHIVEILQYIANNYRTTSLEDVAHQFNYATAYLSRLIKSSTGISYSAYISNLRFQKACSLLTLSDLSLYEVCELAGYGSIEHFHRKFKHESGLTPMEYRNANRNS